MEKDSLKVPPPSGDSGKRRIGVVVAARMKSARLPKKAILPIQGTSSIERCLENCMRFPHHNAVVLATSTLEEDGVLANHTLKGKVKLWRGDPDDVISRYLGACDEYGIDVVIRVTGDSPVVSSEIAEYLLKSHFASGADFTEPKRFAVGTNSQIINVEALRRIIQLIGRAEYSEHMTFYFVNNPNLFKANIVDLPTQLVRDYRLTLDYQEDLEMFNALFRKLEESQLGSSLQNVFKILDENPSMADINARMPLIYKTDKKLLKLLNEKTRIGVQNLDSI
jgi:N,N'-diacetyllegionaminate synthase